VTESSADGGTGTPQTLQNNPASGDKADTATPQRNQDRRGG